MKKAINFILTIASFVVITGCVKQSELTREEKDWYAEVRPTNVLDIEAHVEPQF